ncbi:preprotein translocase subunit YajC [Acinetobacter baumannii]
MFFHLSHNYMLGVGILIFAFIFFLYAYGLRLFKIRKQQRKQNKL